MSTSQSRTNRSKELPEERTILGILKTILPERERWRLEVLKIIADSGEPITSYRIAAELSKRGFKTRISTVHRFLDILKKTGVSYRKKEWDEVKSKCIKISEKGIKVIEILKTRVDSFSSNNQ
jgi:repressor of nif and glnA expression